jgi:VWFA-related protein
MPTVLRRALAVATALFLALPVLQIAPLLGAQPAPDQPAQPAAGGATPPAAAEKPAESSAFFESIDVNVVNVDVYVTDKKGNRIRGLTADDFLLFEEGKPVKISNFYAVDDSADARLPVPRPPIAQGAPPPAPAPARPPVEVETPEDQRLHLVVYIDNWNIKPFDRNRVFAGLREFLRNRLSPTDRVMLMTYDREPHVRRAFTSDAATIAAALFDIEKLSANGARQDSERREVLNWIKDAERVNEAYPRARSYAESLFNDLSFSIDSLKDLVGSLAGLPGRKAILYVSDGLELVPGEDVFNALQEKFTDASNVILESRTWDLTRRFQELIASANANRISFYTVDAGGLRVSTNVSAEQAQPGASSYVDSIYWTNLQGSIQMMAERTGGVAIINTNDPGKGLQVIAADFKNFYSLGYSPAHGGDGRYHKIDVRLKNRKDLVVRHRDGFRDKTVQSRMSDGVTSALFFDVESNPLDLAIERGAEKRRDDGHYEVSIAVKIPIGKLVLVPEGDKQVAHVRLFFAAMDDKGGISEVQESQFPIEIPAAEVAEATTKSWRYDVPLVMREGPQKLAVGLRDELGQVSSFAVRTIRVGG